MSTLQAIYDKSPYWLQHVMLNIYACDIHLERYGKPFRRVFDELKRTQWYSWASAH